MRSIGFYVTTSGEVLKVAGSTSDHDAVQRRDDVVRGPFLTQTVAESVVPGATHPEGLGQWPR